jgi:hypothetical protein
MPQPLILAARASLSQIKSSSASRGSGGGGGGGGGRAEADDGSARVVEGHVLLAVRGRLSLSPESVALVKTALSTLSRGRYRAGKEMPRPLVVVTTEASGVLMEQRESRS